MHYLITGHTGFKGTWLTLMLKELGFKVTGISLDPIDNSIFSRIQSNRFLEKDIRVDIRDQAALNNAISLVRPDFVFHLAAQPLVRHSYRHPEETFQTNVAGTLNLLSAVKNTDTVLGQVIVTTDKVYQNVGKLEGYVETDPLGGSDPYSASKAAADLLTQEWVKSTESPPIAIARAGNVIGGGDISEDRLVPDLIKAFYSNQRIQIRNPDSIRPWQHVLDCLGGYIALSNAVLSGTGEGAWNFSSDEGQVKTVSDLVRTFERTFHTSFDQVENTSENAPESAVLLLNSNKAKSKLGWVNKYDFQTSLELVCEWEKQTTLSNDPLAVTQSQIIKYLET